MTRKSESGRGLDLPANDVGVPVEHVDGDRFRLSGAAIRGFPCAKVKIKLAEAPTACVFQAFSQVTSTFVPAAMKSLDTAQYFAVSAPTWSSSACDAVP